MNPPDIPEDIDNPESTLSDLPPFPARGTKVYNRQGWCGKYVTSILTSDTWREGEYDHFVQPEMEEYQGDESQVYFGGPVLWHEIFAKSPHEVIDAEIAAKNRELVKLSAEVDNLRGQKRIAEKEIAERAARFAKHDQLKSLDAFLTKGAIIGYVTDSGYYGVSTVKMEDTKNDRYRDEFKLLSLFGRSDGNLEWKLNEYYDGSGNWTKVIPFTTEEERRAGILKMFEERFENWKKSENKPYASVSCVESATKHGVPVPDEIRQCYAVAKTAEYAASLLQAEKAVTEAQAKLEKIRTEGTSLVMPQDGSKPSPR